MAKCNKSDKPLKIQNLGESKTQHQFLTHEQITIKPEFKVKASAHSIFQRKTKRQPQSSRTFHETQVVKEDVVTGMNSCSPQDIGCLHQFCKFETSHVETKVTPCIANSMIQTSTALNSRDSTKQDTEADLTNAIDVPKECSNKSDLSDCNFKKTHRDRSQVDLKNPNIVKDTSKNSWGKLKGRKKCRKVYGLDSKHLWCTQCKWKKACVRF